MPNDFSPVLDDADPIATLHEVTGRFERVCLASSLGPQSLVLLDMLHRLGRRIPVLFLDTGVHFPETLELKERVEARYGVTVVSVRAEEPVVAGLWASDPDRCCHLRKVEPLRRALSGYDAWITGVRRDQSPTRGRAAAVSWDEGFGLWKVNPLVRWTRAHVDDYVATHGVPVNPLLSEGYGSIGCAPCTARAPGEREGRWPGLAKTECGLHRREG